MADHAYSIGDWVAITGRVVELHPNDIDLGVELFSKTDQYKAFVRYDLCAPTDRPIEPEPDEGSVALVKHEAYQRLGDRLWYRASRRAHTGLTWAQLGALGDIEVIHHA